MGVSEWDGRVRIDQWVNSGVLGPIGASLVDRNAPGAAAKSMGTKSASEVGEAPPVVAWDRDAIEMRLGRASNDTLLDLLDAFHVSRDETRGGRYVTMVVWRRVCGPSARRDSIRRRLLRFGWGRDTFDVDRGDLLPSWLPDAVNKILDWRTV